MLRKVLASKIHRAVISEANLEYEGSITIPQDLLDAAGILPYEAVAVWDITNGSRFETYAIIGDKPGHICVNGAAAHLVNPGDLIIIANFNYQTLETLQNYQPKIVFVDQNNKILKN